MKTVEFLNSSPTLEFTVKRGENVFVFISEHFPLEFESDSTGIIEFPKSATLKSEGKVGQFLVDLLSQIEHGYSLRPDGVLVIRQIPNVPKLSANSQEKYKSFAESMVSKYDLDKDGKLSGDEVKKLPLPFVGADVNNDGFITVNELISQLSGRTKK